MQAGDTLLSDRASCEILSKLDRKTANNMTDGDLVDILVEAGIDKTVAAAIVHAPCKSINPGADSRHAGPSCRYDRYAKFARVLKVLIVYLSGNIDAYSGRQLLSDLPLP